MAADISDTPTEKRSHVSSSSHVKADRSSLPAQDLATLRRHAELDKQQQLESTIQHHESLLRELYLLSDDWDDHDQFTKFLENGGDPLDTDKLNAFVEQHKLRLVKRESVSENISPALYAEATKRGQQQRRVPPPPERMVTRGVSGAIRHKSVGEILSGLDHNVDYRKEKRDVKRRPAQQRALSLPASRRADSKYYPPQTYNGVKLHDLLSEKEPHIDLFALQLKASAQPLYKVVQTARKALTTHDWKLAWDEQKAIKTVQSIEEMKKKNLWSMKQLKRQKSVARSKTHWDIMLDEMRWMRTDFREERKWKVAMAYTLSRAVMEWHWTEDKSTVCVKTRLPATHDTMNVDSPPSDSFHRAPSPDLSDVGDTMVLDKHPRTQPLPTPPQQQPTEEEYVEEPAALSSAVMQTYRTAIRTLDPNIPVFTLPIEDFGTFDIHALFPDLLTYEPPNPEYDDPYFNELEYGRIVPISKLSTTRMTLKKQPVQLSRKRNSDGEQIPLPSTTVKMPPSLPRSDRYDTTPLISPLFAPRKIRDVPATQPRAPPAPANPRELTNWSEDDDLCLISLILQFGFNWELISDTFNSTRAGSHRSAWECHERWKTNNLTTLSGQVSQQHLQKLKKESSRRLSQRLDTSKRRQRQYNVFEAIKRSQKKRDESQRNAVVAPAPRTTIETHGMNANGQRLPTAMEMSMHKVQRDRQMAQMLLEQRHLSAAYGLGVQNFQGLPRPPAQPPTQPQRSPAPAPARPPPAQPQPQQPQQQPQLNRYPPAQLQLLRQQQMALAAAVQAQAQAGRTQSPRPTSSPVPESSPPQQQQPTPPPQQQPQPNSPQAAAAAAAANPLAVAARLMQMGYPMQQFALQQLAPAQQVQLQRYIAQLHLRAQQQQQQTNGSSSPATQAPALVPSPAGGQRDVPTPQQLAAAAMAMSGGANNANGISAAALLAAQQQQQQRFQAAQMQQLLQMQQQQLQQQQQQQQQQPSSESAPSSEKN